MKKKIKLSIVIATHNRLAFLKKIIAFIERQIDHPFIVTVIVIDDGSDDGTRGFVKSNYPHFIYIQGDGNWWWTKCMNKGFKKAIEIKSDFVLILNDDNEIKEDFLSRIWEDYKQLPKNSILGSVSISIEKPHLVQFAGTKDFIRWRIKAVPYVNKFFPIQYLKSGIYPTWTLCGRGTLIPTKIFKEIGFYDEKLVQYGSDDDFIIRARLSNIHVFISWNSLLFNHMRLTSKGAAHRKDSLGNFIKSFFNKYTVNSLYKSYYLYKKYGIKILVPLYLIYYIMGAFRAYLFKYKK